MTTGEKAVAAIRAHLAASGTSWAKLTGDVVAQIIDAAEAKEQPKRTIAKPTQEWLDALRNDPANEGLDVDKELTRAQLWCNQNRRLCSQRFFVNWLMKAERVIGPGRTTINALPELQGWRLFLEERQAEFGLAEEFPATWDELPRSTREIIHGQKHRLPGLVEFAKDRLGWTHRLQQFRNRRQQGDAAA